MSSHSSDVSVIGLGAMGRVLAQTLLDGGRRVTVWNRSPDKAAPLKAAGAAVAATPAEAVAASPVTILVVLNEAAVNEVLDQILPAAAGRAIVNLSSGRPPKVAELAARVTGAGGRFLSGSILANPRHIGLADAPLLYSGDRSVMDEFGGELRLFGGRTQFVNETWGGAKSLSYPLYIQAFSALSGFVEGVSLARRQGMAASEYADWVKTILAPFYGRIISDVAHRLDTSEFSGDQSTVDTHHESVVLMTEMLNAAGVQSKTLEAFEGYLRQAQAAGRGGDDVASIASAVAAEPQA